jgi:hypothetical protein
VESDDLDRLRAVAKLLPLFNSGQPFYDLSRELIRRTDDRSVLGSIKAAVNSTPGAIWGGLSSFYDQRLQEISAWLNDDNWRVRHFSKHLQRYLQAQIEQERAEEEFARRTW